MKMYHGHSSSPNLSMGGYSSDGSTSWMRDKPQFPLETDRLSFNGRSLMENSDWAAAIEGGAMDLVQSHLFNEAEPSDASFQFPNNQINEAETSGASFQTEAGCGQSKLTPAQRNRKRQADDKMRVLQGLVPGCSKAKGKEAILDAIIEYVQSFQRQNKVAEEKAAENIQLKAENERLYAENTMLKEQTGLQPFSGKNLEHQSVSLQDHHGTNSEAVDKQEIVPVNATSLMSGGVILPNANLSQLETVPASNFSSFTRVGLMQESQDISEVNGVKSVSGVEAPGDACLQAQEISIKKRKRSVQDAEVDQAKGGQPLNMATQGSVENQDKGVWNLTTTTNKSTRKQGRQGSQASDPPEEENVHTGSQIGLTTIGHGIVQQVRREKIKEKMRVLELLVPGCSKVAGSALMLDEIIKYVQSLQRQVEFLSKKLAASRAISDSDAAISDILLKLEADDESTVKLSDFADLDGEKITIGKYNFPISLHPIVKKIIGVYGDVSATSKMNPSIAEVTYLMFCASVKEMNDHRLEQVTEGLILKWRDAIRDALYIHFKVDFAMEHLRKIARGYIGLMEQSKIRKLEDQLSDRKERSKEFMKAAEDFCGKPVSSGLFPDAQAT